MSMPLLQDEMVDRGPMTVAQMTDILKAGRSIAYHGKSGDRFITRIEEIPPVDILVADGYLESDNAEADLAARIAKLSAEKEVLAEQRRQRIRDKHAKSVKEALSPYDDNLSEIEMKVRRKPVGRKPDPVVEDTDPVTNPDAILLPTGFTESETD